MKTYIFGLGVLLMLSFSLAGMTWTAALTLRRASDRFGPLTAVAIGFVSLVVLITALAWSVPAREAV
ncbi:hypothetical protein [Paraburkholderia phenoliruptrix]|uniref:hypothetical protein n=1 Tax=Paraburkholderia phenoliruptrix TaxID=252970 RepID=UPI0028552CCF|nr:hypothetical protein [Paraburkholderia phenoliruptrix]MDR6387595.1 hypothetical protein [Paraburkholderia phenoliruptrix]